MVKKHIKVQNFESRRHLNELEKTDLTFAKVDFESFLQKTKVLPLLLSYRSTYFFQKKVEKSTLKKFLLWHKKLRKLLKEFFM